MNNQVQFRETLTFDDVLLEPRESNVLPGETQTQTRLTPSITLNIPLISAAMDTVTESRLAIALAQEGGIGTIHYNMSVEAQAEEVRRVKRYESWMVVQPITISPQAPLSLALELMSKHEISGIPVVDGDNDGRLVGILTNRDVRFVSDLSQLVKDHMTSKDLVTVREGVSVEEAKSLLHLHRIEKLLVVDENYCCIGLITFKDITKSELYPKACKDEKGCLRVGAAIGVNVQGLQRAQVLMNAGVDILIIDTAHGHSQKVLETITEIRNLSNKTQIIAGNVATQEGARALIKAGVDAVKVGIGPGSICTTRMVAGVGIPQLSAIIDVSKVCQEVGIPVIADGGIKYSGDIAKALAAGANCVMIGGLFAGTVESPGGVSFYKGRPYKNYRGMGAIKETMYKRYTQPVQQNEKFVPEGIEGRVPYRGSVSDVIHQLIGGVKAAMGYTGSKTIKDLQKNARFVRITNAGLRESHVHDVQITNEAPNYVPYEF